MPTLTVTTSRASDIVRSHLSKQDDTFGGLSATVFEVTQRGDALRATRRALDELTKSGAAESYSAHRPGDTAKTLSKCKWYRLRGEGGGA